MKELVAKLLPRGPDPFVRDSGLRGALRFIPDFYEEMVKLSLRLSAELRRQLGAHESHDEVHAGRGIVP
jgi:hypothetical protein